MLVENKCKWSSQWKFYKFSINYCIYHVPNGGGGNGMHHHQWYYVEIPPIFEGQYMEISPKPIVVII